MTLVVVSATTNYTRARPCIDSWGDVPIVLVINGYKAPEIPKVADNITAMVQIDYLGTVPAFKAGVDWALEHTNADIIACLHDDLLLQDPLWAEKVIRRFEQQPAMGLLGFGGAIGLGDSDIYQKPYAPQQLARIGFRSNLQDAEVHGIRSLLAERVACLDGFSQLGRREFWEGKLGPSPRVGNEAVLWKGVATRPWHQLEDLGVMHHAYDGMLGCLAARYGWETWYLPIRCRHLGGQTAVGDSGYQQWAQTQTEGGDHGFWQAAHKIWYDNFNDQLPLRV